LIEVGKGPGLTMTMPRSRGDSGEVYLGKSAY
jgi:hypothetical protein